MQGQALLNQIRGEAERVMGHVSQTRFGVVDGVDPAAHAVRVKMQPEGALTGWLPVMALSVGAGWGLHALPAIGAQVVVGFQEGSAEAGVVLGALYSRKQPPPATPAGAIWLTSENGARLQLNADGTVDFHAVQLRLDADTLASIVSAAVASVTAPEILLGAAGQTVRGLLTDVARGVFNTHTHPAPNGTTGIPNEQMGADSMTSTVKAG
jgi:phage baseplate assembly protein V